MSSGMLEDRLQTLVDYFRSSLDEALIVAIASDSDLKQVSEYDRVWATLEELARDAASEEASGFNPSGVSNIPADDNSNDSPSDNVSASGTTNSKQASRTQDTETSCSDLASIATEGSYSMPRLTSFNDCSEEDKISQLSGIFTDLKEYDIRHSLTKAKGDFQTALDDLLNIQYRKSTGQEQKGIDAFFQPDEEAVTKKKGKKKKKRGKKPSTSSSGSSTPRDNVALNDPEKEMRRQDEIAYIADRLHLPFGEVSDIYYRKRCASGATTVEILDQHISLGIEAQDDAGKEQAKELAEKYRNVPEKYMLTVVHVTGSFPQWSDDIAALLAKHFAKNPWTQKLDVNYTLKPLSQDEGIEGWHTEAAGKRGATKSLARGTGQPSDSVLFAQASEKANQYYQAKREAAASAAALNRRAAGNPLLRQAAGFYSELAREQGRFAQQATSTAADLKVDQQSTANSIDLHGVYVQDGVRIARERTQAWWNGLGDFKSEKARQQGFKVITGIGRHSSGGVSVLRQAVVAALLQDGWKLEVETGWFLVRGLR